MITLEIDEKPDTDWNNRLLNSEGGNIYQTKEYGIHLIRMGQTPYFVKFINGKGNIIGQLLLGSIARFKKKGNKGKLLNKFPGVAKEIYRWTYGPVIFNNKFNNEIFFELNKLIKLKKCLIHGKTNPFFSIDAKSLEKNFQIKKWKTHLINLQDDKETLYHNIDKHSGRKNIERSIKRGVCIEEITEKNIPEYVKLRNDTVTEETNKVTEQEMIDWLQLLHPIGYGGFMARVDEIPIGGIFFASFNKIIIEGGVARSKKDYELKLYSQDLIKWKIIEWGINNNMRYYDLAGFNPNPTNPKEEGIKRYKEKWGGKETTYWILSNKK